MGWQHKEQITIIFSNFMLRIDNVDIVTHSTSFDVLYFGVDILKHSTDFPLMALGHGTFEAEEHLGNFELSDSMDRRYDLTEWTIGQFI